jgi:hypothetical protein
MVLTATCSLSVAQAGRAEVRVMFISALGCSVAWGIVDAVMYLVSRLAERRQKIDVLRTLRTAADSGEARRLVAAAVPPEIASLVRPLEDEDLLRRVKELPSLRSVLLTPRTGTVAIFLLVVLSTPPVAVPFCCPRPRRGPADVERHGDPDAFLRAEIREGRLPSGGWEQGWSFCVCWPASR